MSSASKIAATPVRVTTLSVATRSERRRCLQSGNDYPLSVSHAPAVHHGQYHAAPGSAPTALSSSSAEDQPTGRSHRAIIPLAQRPDLRLRSRKNFWSRPYIRLALPAPRATVPTISFTEPYLSAIAWRPFDLSRTRRRVTTITTTAKRVDLCASPRRLPRTSQRRYVIITSSFTTTGRTIGSTICPFLTRTS